MSASDSPANPNVVSFYIETSAGGLPITLCTCGLLIYQPMAPIHTETCEAFQRVQREGNLR